MKVLLLGPWRDAIVSALHSLGDEVVQLERPLSEDDIQGVQFLVSFGYRHLLKRQILGRFHPGRALNMHISLLPWNRGADPNLWSFLEDSPKGVTIHIMDEGLDTGPILAQEEVKHLAADTLASSHQRLTNQMVELFGRHWPDIRDGRIVPRPQCGAGSFHRMRDRDAFAHLLVNGWDTPIAGLIGKALTPQK